VTICIVDTSILVQLLNVPEMSGQRDELMFEYERRASAREQFLLPIAVLIETGNHIAKANDGRLPRPRHGGGRLGGSQLDRAVGSASRASPTSARLHLVR
jgi:hypothetical protein